MIVVGINGLVGAGKDTIADILVKHRGFTKIPFAMALKNEVKDRLHDALVAYVVRAYGRLDPEAIEVKIHELLFRDRDPFTRALLQNYGTEVRRKDDSDYWVKRFWANVHGRDETTKTIFDKIVVPDVRFDNEYDSILNCNNPMNIGIVMKVNRNVPIVYNHSSEAMAKDPGRYWHLIIDNNGTIPELEKHFLTWYDNFVILKGIGR